MPLTYVCNMCYMHSPFKHTPATAKGVYIE
jgi:hypothetical protein